MCEPTSENVFLSSRRRVIHLVQSTIHSHENAQATLNIARSAPRLRDIAHLQCSGATSILCQRNFKRSHQISHVRAVGLLLRAYYQTSLCSTWHSSIGSSRRPLQQSRSATTTAVRRFLCSTGCAGGTGLVLLYCSMSTGSYRQCVRTCRLEAATTILATGTSVQELDFGSQFDVHAQHIAGSTHDTTSAPVHPMLRSFTLVVSALILPIIGIGSSVEVSQPVASLWQLVRTCECACERTRETHSCSPRRLRHVLNDFRRRARLGDTPVSPAIARTSLSTRVSLALVVLPLSAVCVAGFVLLHSHSHNNTSATHLVPATRPLEHPQRLNSSNQLPKTLYFPAPELSLPPFQ